MIQPTYSLKIIWEQIILNYILFHFGTQQLQESRPPGYLMTYFTLHFWKTKNKDQYIIKLDNNICITAFLTI